MTYRMGEASFADETAAYVDFLGRAHPETWGTMTMAEWRTAPQNQAVSWDEWAKVHRPTPTSEPSNAIVDKGMENDNAG